MPPSSAAAASAVPAGAGAASSGGGLLSLGSAGPSSGGAIQHFGSEISQRLHDLTRSGALGEAVYGGVSSGGAGPGAAPHFQVRARCCRDMPP